MTTIGNRVQKILSHFDLNDRELGDIAGVTKQAVGKWKLQNTKPDADALINMRRSLGVDDIWLLTGKGTMLLKDAEDPWVKEMIELSRHLSDSAKARVLHSARFEKDSEHDE